MKKTLAKKGARERQFSELTKMGVQMQLEHEKLSLLVHSLLTWIEHHITQS